MNVLLIVPGYSLINKINYEYTFPLGLAYISAVMKKAGHNVDVLNMNHFNGKMDELLTNKLDSKNYDIICSGHSGIGYAVILKMIEITKNHSTRPKIILGGPLITTETKLIFEYLNPDFGILGEAEETVVDLLDAIENKRDYSQVNGIVYWKDNQSIQNPPRPAIKDLDTIPTPDFEGFDFVKQLEHRACNSLFDHPRIYPMLCGRGCPFECTFCYHAAGFRQRSIKHIMDELRENVKKYKINMIAIYDDMFSINKDRLFEFCDEIKALIDELDWDCKWTCQFSVVGVDKEMIDKVKSSGCYAISFGFESYSQKILKSMKKPITPALIDNVVKLTFEAKMPLWGNFIFGDIAETPQTAKETLDYHRDHCKGQIKLLFVQPYPGSYIYDHCVKKGIIKDRLDFIKNEISHVTWYNVTDEMNDDEILQLKKDILQARKNSMRYSIPLRIEKYDSDKDDRYNLLIKCPFCEDEIEYKNCLIENKLYYTIQLHCRNCAMGYYAVSRPYKFSMDHYDKLEFFRKNYLLIRDNIRKKLV